MSLPPIPRAFLSDAVQSRFVMLVLEFSTAGDGPLWTTKAWPRSGNKSRTIVADFAVHDARGQAAVVLDKQKENPIVFTNETGKDAKMEEA